MSADTDLRGNPKTLEAQVACSVCTISSLARSGCSLASCAMSSAFTMNAVLGPNLDALPSGPSERPRTLMSELVRTPACVFKSCPGGMERPFSKRPESHSDESDSHPTTPVEPPLEAPLSLSSRRMTSDGRKHSRREVIRPHYGGFLKSRGCLAFFRPESRVGVVTPLIQGKSGF